MTKYLQSQIDDALKDRSSWEQKQATLNTMRNGGTKRRSKPYPGAPDLHYKIGDTLISKIKPLYVQQMYSGETVASFVSLRAQDSEATASANNWFDYNLKQKTNFQKEVMIAADQMEERGFSIVKVRWDASAKKLMFTACEPLNIIVPQSTEEVCDADFLVHVIPMSIAQYKSNPLFNQDEDFIKSISGKENRTESGNNNFKSNKESREGITHSDNSNTIILWEVYRRDREKKTITVETVSPLLPWDENEVRDSFGLPYNMGVFKDGDKFPFMKFRAEIREKGYYSERGTVEVTAAHESSLNKIWNQRHQWMDFHSNPTYTTDKPVPNPSNIKTGPGQIMGDGLTPNFPPPIPNSLMEEMEFTRALAEQRIAIPDLGATQHLTSGGGGGPDRVTATQIQAIVGQSGQGNDLRSRIFRMDLGELLNMAWSLLIQYQCNEFIYVLDEKIQEITKEAIHAEYIISPNGSPDSWNKGAQVQKRMAIFQSFQGNQYIKQDELIKWVMEADDPRLIHRLFQDPGIAQQDQAEIQAMEIQLMQDGFPPRVKETDDDAIHLTTMGQYVQRRMSLGEQITPEHARLFLQHGSQHDQAMEQKKNPQLKMIREQAIPMIQLLTQIAQSDQQGDQGNVIPFGGQDQGQPQQTPPQAPQAPPAPPIDPTKVGNMLVNMAKAGMPVSRDEINTVLQGLGLPPLTVSPPAQSNPQPQVQQQ